MAIFIIINETYEKYALELLDRLRKDD